MGFGELFLLAVGLSMDAFAVSVCKGLASSKASLRNSLSCGIWFGGFQALMPVIGFFLGVLFADAIEAFDHWIAFVLLAIIGANMLKEAFSCDCCCEQHDADFSAKSMFVMAVATSIDALAVGITFACVPVNFLQASELVNTAAAVCIIGIITFALSCVGTKIGSIFGSKYRARAEFFGGAILILIGLKILLEHLL